MKRRMNCAALALLMLLLSACGATAETPKETADAVTAATETEVDVIFAAGTTQSFTDEAVPQEDIETILRAGLAAESALNAQPWFFAAVTDQELLSELTASQGIPSFPQGGNMPSFGRDGERPAMPQGGSMPAMPEGGASGAKASLGDSPLAIVIYKDGGASMSGADFDCGLAAQNMYLAAVSLGCGAKLVSSPTMTLNGANHDAICEKLGVDPSYTAVAVLLIGKPDESVDGVTGATERASLAEKTTIR